MVVFTVKIDGVPKTIEEFGVTESEYGVITVTLPYATVVAIGDSFEIETGGTTWIKGTVQRIRRTREGMVDKKFLTCYGRTHLLFEKYCLHVDHHVYANKDVGWIANDLIDHYFAGVLTSVNVDTTIGVNFTTFDCYGLSVGDALRKLAEHGDSYFYVDNDDDVYFFIRGTVPSGLTAEDLDSIKIVDESGRKYSKVIIQGRHRDIQGSAGAGYPEYFKQDDRITTSTEAGEVATSLLAELSVTRQQIEACEQGFVETRAGKTIILNVPADGFNDQVIEIQSIRWECKTPNLNRTWFTLGDREPTIDTILADIMSKIYWRPDVQILRGNAFPTDPSDGEAFTLINDVAVPGVYYGAIAGILYTWDEANSVWKRPPCYLGRRAANPPAGGEVTGDTFFHTGSQATRQWDGAVWYQVSSRNLFSAPDFGVVEWPTDQLAIEMRPWTGNFSLIWDDKDDEPPTDWNHFKWGLKDQENVADAQIHYADGVTIDVNFGQDIDVADGEWFVYWDEAQITGGDYDVQWTQNYSLASGAGKGLLAVVQVRNAASESPSLMLYNTYIPQMGVGSLVAHSIYSKHISGDWITGKNFRTANLVGEIGGPAGIRFNANEIAGYSGGVTKQFYLQTADGKAMAGGGKVILDSNGVHIIGDAGAMLTIHKTSLLDPRGTLWNGTINGIENIILSDGALGFGAVLQAGASYFQVKPGGSFYFAGPSLLPVGGPPNIGAVGTPFGDIWGSVHYADMYLSDIHCDKCGELFKQANDVIFTVKGFRDYEEADLKEIVLVPVHRKCPIIPRIKRWLNGLLR